MIKHIVLFKFKAVEDKAILLQKSKKNWKNCPK